ncbi:MAG: hypothetical protein ACRDNZ_16810, partial [Streptosporangiaceae bacterium]
MAGSKDRQRKLERERYQRQLDKRARREQQVRRWTVASLAGIVVLAVAVGVFFLVRPSGSNAASSASSTSASSPPSAATPSAPAAAAAPVAEPASHCVYTAS